MLQVSEHCSSAPCWDESFLDVRECADTFFYSLFLSYSNNQFQKNTLFLDIHAFLQILIVEWFGVIVRSFWSCGACYCIYGGRGCKGNFIWRYRVSFWLNARRMHFWASLNARRMFPFCLGRTWLWVFYCFILVDDLGLLVFRSYVLANMTTY